MNITVVLPSLNPDEKMVGTVRGLIEKGFDDIVVVDDGSKTDCKKFFKEVESFPEVSVLVHEVNKGKGRAMKTAFEYLLNREKKTNGVVTVDGDGQHLPDDIKKCVGKMEEKGDSVILGVRDFSQKDVPARSRFGNNLTRAVFRLCGVSISDTQTGLRAIPYKYLKAMTEIEGERYEYETRQLLELEKLVIPVSEVVIQTVYIDDNESSHFNPIKDSIKIYKVIFKYMSETGNGYYVGMKFLFASLSSFLLEFLLFTIINMVSASYDVAAAVRIPAANTIGRIVSSVYNYYINHRLVFKSKQKALNTGVKYAALVVVQLTCSTALIYTFAHLLFDLDGSFLESIVKMIVDSILFFISFFIQRKFVF